MSSNGLRVGVIGVGFGATVQVPGFQSEGVDVVALCSQREERVQQAAAVLNVPHVYTDYLKLIERDDLDAVSIVTPPAFHHEMVMAALRAGKHVLCEKPFAMDAAQAKEMRDAARERGLTAMIAHEFRFSPQRAYVRDLLDEGYVGAVRMVSMEMLFGFASGRGPRPMAWGSQASMGGGLLGALGSHYIDALRHWCGELTGVGGKLVTLLPERVDEATGQSAVSDADDAFSLTASLAGGGIATLTASMALAVPQGVRLSVHGDRGALLTPQPGPNPPPEGIVYGAKAGEAFAELPMPEHYLPFADARDLRLLPFRLLVREFAKGVQGGTSPSPNFDDGYRCQQVLDAVRESSATGRWVEVPRE